MDQEVTEQKNYNAVKESVKKLSYTLAYHQRIQSSVRNTPHRGLRPIGEKLVKSTTFVKEQIEFLESEQIASIAAGSKNDRTESTCAKTLTDIISNLWRMGSSRLFDNRRIACSACSARSLPIPAPLHISFMSVAMLMTASCPNVELSIVLINVPVAVAA
jgi:hypothetical protein